MVKYIWNTLAAQLIDYNNLLKDITKFLIQNRAAVLPPQVLDPIFQTKPYMKTIINELFERCYTTGYVTEAAPLFFTGREIGSVNELLSINNLVIDYKNNINNTPFSSYPEFNNKFILNLSGIIKQNAATRQFVVSDMNELHSMYVRAMLTRSYSVSDGWLNPTLAYYIIKTYALCIANIIGKTENLSLPEQMTVAIIFALYMSQQFARTDEDPAKPRIFYRCTYLGTINTLEEIATRAQEIKADGLDLAGCCELVRNTGPTRLKNFDLNKFLRLCVTLGSQTTILPNQIALEYAPYFVMMILNVLTGGRGGSLQLYMKNNRLIGTESKAFMEELKVCKSLFMAR